MAEYISREDILDIASQYCVDDDGSCSKVDVDLREMLDEIEALPAADVQPVDRWIDAQKNLPPIVDRRSMTSESVLILIDNGRCAVAYYCYDDEDGNCWVTDDEKTIYDLEDVTRWQPLPEPPKGGDTD